MGRYEIIHPLYIEKQPHEARTLCSIACGVISPA